MVLSCSLHDFLSPLGVEIRLGFWKRIFYSTFFLPGLFFFLMFSVQNDLFGNLIWIFFPSSFLTAFFFLLFAVTRNKDVCPMDFKRGETWNGYFFQIRMKKIKIMAHSFFYPSTLINRFILEMKSYHWTLAVLKDFKMDIYSLENWWLSWRSGRDSNSPCCIVYKIFIAIFGKVKPSVKS